ncbi:uncharacterized protein LOC121768719 [Salvia splendens]|uniref:uncharacterized protein LOC121768719 n=1 Tax=Salvia splendens TaxID=180675 RepID=UPI001C26BDEC|nr:uncharacterized protein LOC121768719 [Salvia splendens]
MVKDEEMRAAEQMKKCMVYEVSLKQWWEQIHSVEKEGGGKDAVVVDARVRRLVCRALGMEAEKGGCGGLSLSLYEKMRWVQETRGWFDGEREVRVKGNKEVGSESSWTRLGCYVLLESFVFRRMDGSLLINFNFRNTDKIVCKWESVLASKFDQFQPSTNFLYQECMYLYPMKIFQRCPLLYFNIRN